MQAKSQYCKTKSQIKQEDNSGMTQHGLIFTGTTPIGNTIFSKLVKNYKL